MRKTKIVCTIGPVSENESTLKKLIKAGLNAARLNFSHGDFEEHGNRIKLIKKLRVEMKRPIAIMLDTKGPEIRLRHFENGKVELKEGQDFTVTTEDIMGNNGIVSVTYEDLHNDVKPGDVILVDDGLIGLSVKSIEGKNINCKVLNSGVLGDRKGVNLPNIKINLPALTQKDIDDICFGIRSGVDIIAASFVRKAADVLSIRKVLDNNGGAHVKIVSKIENREGVDNIDEILEFSDGIMVARGDLGVEIPVEEVPVVQKMIIKKCNQAGKPVITATQMLDSMIRNPRPTRAEASDVANAILDGTDAVMLSGETANGKYPVEAVKIMAKIARKAENSLDYELMLKSSLHAAVKKVPEAVSLASVSTAGALNASAIITVSQTGRAARRISKYRPKCPIIAVCPTEEVARTLGIVWGVYPIIASDMNTVDEVLEKSVNISQEMGYVNVGDLVVVVTGVPVGYAGTTNLMKVHIVGKLLVRGVGVGAPVYSYAYTLDEDTDFEEVKHNINKDDILVAKSLKDEYAEVLDKVKGVIVEEDGNTSDVAMQCINQGIPLITGAKDAVKIIKSGAMITMDTTLGIVYSGKANIN